MTGVQIVEVIPASRVPLSRRLTFFNVHGGLAKGQIVFVDIRGKRTLAVVTSVKLLTDKSEVKMLSFQIKKLGKQTVTLYVGKAFIDWLKTLADRLLVTDGELLSLILPADAEKIINKGKVDPVCFPKRDPARPDEILSIEGSFNERASYYLNGISSEINRKVLLIIVPNQSHGLILKQKCKDIDPLALRRIKISTPTHALFNTDNIGAIVVEKESASYRQIRSPYIDTREYITDLARALGVRLYFADDFLSLEARSKSTETICLPNRNSPRVEIVDIRPLRAKTGGPLNILSPQLRRVIERSISKKASTLVISARRGQLTSLVCNDCGSETSEKVTLCANCGSWRLATLGVGLEGVESQIRHAHPNLPPEQFTFVTEAMLPQITGRYDAVVMAYIDSLFAIPGFRIRERIFRSIVEARNLAKSDFLIQTRRIDDPIFSQASQGTTEDFVGKDMKARVKFGYPPAMHIIKVTTKGKRDIIRQPISDWPREELLAKLLPMRSKARIELDPESII